MRYQENLLDFIYNMQELSTFMFNNFFNSELSRQLIFYIFICKDK
jgi:hypothetical protein